MTKYNIEKMRLHRGPESLAGEFDSIMFLVKVTPIIVSHRLCATDTGKSSFTNFKGIGEGIDKFP